MEENTKSFWKRASVFLVSLLILILIINYAYFQIFIEKKQIYRNELELENYLSQNNGKIDYLFVGSSHTKDAINPHFINNSFNIATGGEGTYILAYYQLRNILEKQDAKVDKVIIEVDPHILNDRAYPLPFSIENLWYWSNLFKYNEIKPLTSLSYPDYLLQSKLYFMNGAKDFDIFFHKGELSETYRGWVANNNNLSNEPDGSDYANQYFKVTFKNTNSSLNPIGADYLLRLVKLSKENNVSIVLIKHPLPSEYLMVINESGFDLNKYYSEIYELMDKNGINYQVLDYQSIFNSTSYFGDAGHLNSGTSIEYSRKVENDLLSRG